MHLSAQSLILGLLVFGAFVFGAVADHSMLLTTVLSVNCN